MCLAITAQKGVLSYSGERLATLAFTAGQPGFLVISIAETADGKVWMGTRDQGLFTLNAGLISSVAPGLPDRKINNEPFFSNNAFIFVNKDGMKQAGRYKILPAAGQRHLSETEAKSKPADFLIDDLKKRLATEPIKFRLVVQLPNPGDPTKDSSLVWPEDRKTIDTGVISITSVAADSAAAEKSLAFDPMNLTDGIEQSDDPLPALRSRVYALAASYRRQAK
jgi:catalase